MAVFIVEIEEIADEAELKGPIAHAGRGIPFKAVRGRVRLPLGPLFN